MKKIKFIILILTSVFVASCSNNDDAPTTPAPVADYFNLVYDGQAKTVTSWQALRQEDFIEVAADTQSGLGIDFKFNIYGNMYEAFTHPNSGSSTIPFQAALYEYSASTFTFQMVEFNAANNTVEVNFSGKVYDDEFDHQSPFKVVSGSFKVTLTNVAPTITGMGTFAKINGVDWHGQEKSASSSSSDNSTALNIQNGSEYTIEIVYPYFSPIAGTFAFANNTVNKRVSLSRYDLATHTIINYNVSGTVTYTTANSDYVQGTFSLTATHPTNGSTISITNGTFKELSAN